MPSIWDTVKAGPSKDWTHWPNPFGFYEDILVMACEDDFWIRVKMYGMLAGAFFMSNLLPSPVEISRKLVSGSYKCGFYLPGVKAKSPLDLIWTDGKASAVLRGTVSPVTTGLFYMWAASTAWEFMSTWGAVPVAIAKCNADGNECVLVGGEANFLFDDMEGAPGSYTEVYDPQGRYTPPGGSVAFNAGSLSLFAHGFCGSLGRIIDDISFQFFPSSLGAPEISIGPIDALGRRAWSLEWTGSPDSDGAAFINVHIQQHGTSIAPSFVIVESFIVNNKPQPVPPPNAPIFNFPPRCFALNMPPLVTDLS